MFSAGSKVQSLCKNIGRVRKSDRRGDAAAEGGRRRETWEGGWERKHLFAS